MALELRLSNGALSTVAALAMLASNYASAEPAQDKTYGDKTEQAVLAGGAYVKSLGDLAVLARMAGNAAQPHSDTLSDEDCARYERFAKRYAAQGKDFAVPESCNTDK